MNNQEVKLFFNNKVETIQKRVDKKMQNQIITIQVKG